MTTQLIRDWCAHAQGDKITNPVIPMEAVEAALTVLRRDDLWELSDEEEARIILEAAAPHMLDAGWAKAYAVGFEDAKGGKNYNAADTNPYRVTK